MTNHIRRPVHLPVLSAALLAVLVTSACGTSEPAADGSTAAAATADAVAADTGPDAQAPDACSLLTVEDITTATGATYSSGTGTDYDNTCTFDTSSDRITVSLSEVDPLEAAEPIGTEVVEVRGLPGATRVDAVVYLELDGLWLSVATGLPGFAASERDAQAAEALAVVAASRL